MTFRKIFALIALGLAFLTCNIEPEKEYRINLFLNDSLSYEYGKYDSLRISIIDSNGSVLQPNVFRGRYYADSAQGLLLGATRPDRYSIRILAFRGGDSAIYDIPVLNGEAQKLTVTLALPVPIIPEEKPVVTAPKEILLDDSVLTLGYFGNTGTTVRIYPTLKPAGSVGILQYRSDNPLVADVDESGLIVAKGTGETHVRVSLAGATDPKASVRIVVKSPPSIQSVNWIRESATVYVGAPERQLKTIHNPPELSPIFEFRSSDTGVISVTQEAWVKAKRAGDAVIKVKAIGLNPVEDTIHLHAVMDAPVLEIGPSQKVSVGQRVNIPIRATQMFGTLRLSWDFDEDGIPDTVVHTDTALATHVYGQAGDFDVEITAADDEGNVTSKSVRVQVGKAGPLILFVSPKSDTIVNRPELQITYTADNVEKQRKVQLTEGSNTVTARDTNETGVDSATVTVILDTKAPKVKIIEPANGTITRLPTLDVIWSIDEVVQPTRNKEVLSGKQGKISIIRRHVDSAGNPGMDSIAITYDTIPPGPPVFLAGDTNTNQKKPEWAWKSGGGGNGLYSYQLGALTETITNQTRFSPGQDLMMGSMFSRSGNRTRRETGP